jgi:putative transposase
VRYAASRQHGVPEALVSAGGGVFRATQAQHVSALLGIRKEQIERRQPWQSSIETQVNVQRRLADWHVAQATSWPELLAAHDRWVVDFNYQVHWAHRERAAERHSPVEVLGWVHGRQVTPEELPRIFYATRFCRKLARAGYVRFRHWRVYGETLTVSFADEALAQYTVSYQPDRHHLAAVVELERFETPYQSPQPPLWNLTADDWRTVIKGAPYAPRRPRNDDDALQPHLFPEDMIDEAS